MMVGQLEVEMTQQTPKPAAQFPSATPLLSVHSDLDNVFSGNKYEVQPWNSVWHPFHLLNIQNKSIIVKLFAVFQFGYEICLVKKTLLCFDKTFYINWKLHWKLTLSSKCPLWLSCFPPRTPCLEIGRWRTGRTFLKCKNIRLWIHIYSATDRYYIVTLCMWI